MDRKNVRVLIRNVLEDLSHEDFVRFRDMMREPRGDGIRPERFRRAQVDKKNYTQITDVLVEAFADKVVEITVRLLRTIHCNQAANELEEAYNQPVGWDKLRIPSSRLTRDRNDLRQSVPRWDSAPGAPGREIGAAVSAPSDGHFVDRHRITLIERVSNMGPILDHLLQEGVLRQEQYDRAMEIGPTESQMRFLFSGPLRSGGDHSKKVFMDALCVQEPYLVQDLWSKEG